MFFLFYTSISFQLVYMGFVVYLPALALNAVTPIKLRWSIILTSGLCTLYTAVVSTVYKIIYHNG